MILTEIRIYPIKSLGGIRVDSSRVMQKGLEYDRRWMLVDSNNKFITQREVHRLALFKLSLGDDCVEVTYGDDELEIPLQTDLAGAQRATIWEDEVEVAETESKHNEWFSRHLDMDCKLVFFPESSARRVDPNYVVDDMHVSLADGYPFLIIGQSSLDDLNQRLSEPVEINRFRPNFVFTGGEPYEEDTWGKIQIGENYFEGVNPCARCILTTVDQDTGIKGREPLLTLSKYRKSGDKILFGQNLIAFGSSTIKVGEKITIESFK